MIPRRYAIRTVCQKTGLEESEIRYFETVFKEFLTFTRMGLDKQDFTDDHIELLCRIKELIRKRGFSIEEVKKELKQVQKARQQGDGLPPAKEPSYARVIAVTSGKGGVGKTTLTVNLAIGLAQRNKRVAIFDADLGLSNVHILMGVRPRFNLSHVIQDGFSLDDVIVEGPLGVKVISGGQGVREMANLREEQRRVLLRHLDQLEREVDILLVDTGAGISENVLRFTAFADEVIVVTTSNIAAAADAFSIIKILREMEPNSKIGLVTNQAENHYHSKNIYNRINEATEKHLRYTLGDLGFILDDEHMMAANQARKPVLLSYPNSPAAGCIRSILDTLLNEKVFVNMRKESSFQDLMGAVRRNMVGVA